MTRRKEKARPEGLIADTSLPARLASPHEARAYVGRPVCRYFSFEESDSPGWYFGRVISVDVDADTAFLTVEYEDKDTEELYWNEFVRWAVTEDSMPPTHTDGGEAAGAAADPHTPDGAAQIGGAAAGGTAPRKRSASAAGLAPDSPESPTPVRQQRTRSASTGVHVKQEPGADGEGGSQLGPQRSRRSQASRGRGEDGAAAEREGEADGEEEDVARPRVRRRLDMDQAADGQPHEATGAAGAGAGAALSSAPAPPADGAGGSRAGVASQSAAPQQQRLSAAAVMQKKWKLPRDPRPAGHLRRIQLINFMCHKNLEVEFGPHVTFLSGQNGSGKSAVLQGLQACLGASARDTSRGSNLSGWVKVGCNTASVALELWNTREEDTAAGQRTVPFRYELYGPVIKIVRKLHSKGGGTFQLYNAHGVEVKQAQIGQSPAKEVSALADHFHVDAANPLMIITQDMSARFHQKTSGSGARSCSKYEMFMEGTCLAAARDTLAAAEQKIARADANLARQQGRLAERSAAVKQLEAKVKELQQAADMRQLLGDVEAALMWSTRAEMEDTRVAQLPARLKELEAAKREAARRQTAARRELERLDESIRSLKDTKSEREADLQALAAAAQSDTALQSLAAHNERLNAKTQELEGLQEQLAALEARRLALAGEKATAEQEEAIRRAPPNTFSRPPFGPVGLYLRRVPGSCDQAFAALLEHALSNVLDGWIVNQRDDSDRLQALARQAELGGYRPQVSVAPFKDRVHPYKPGPLLCDPHTGVVCKRVVDLLQPAPPNEEAMTDTWVARGGLQHWDVWTAYDLEGTKYEERNSTLITNARCTAELSTMREETPAAASEALSAELMNALTQLGSQLQQQASARAERESELNNAAASALRAWVNRTERDIERLEADGNLETIRARADEARASFKIDLDAYKAVQKKVKVMRENQSLREVKYIKIRDYAERVVSAKFQQYMLRRNFAASLALSHGPPGRLELSVRPTNQQEAPSSLMQLSGGERSFTTVAFLLAVGAMLDSPFRCCDEIDVYMDPTNRKVSTAALLEYAWLFNSGSQLVMLSPQDSKTTQECEDALVKKCQADRRPVPPKDFCKILVLQPPRE
eukprot:XP_001697007.1 structural maintenance of chromosomes protein 6B [Chlamydomonas reinhardtii]